MRIATYNVENLFSRAVAMNQESWDEGKEVLAAFSALTVLLQEPVYTPAVKADIITQVNKLGLRFSDETDFVILRQNRGALLKRTAAGVEVVAAGRGSWIGWVELKKGAVNEVATRMTARVITDVNADVLCVVEAEDRIALKRFNEQLLKPAAADYDRIMLIDGNDERGIDVGLLTRGNITIESICSHIDDQHNGNWIFSRDCPEYTVRVNPSTTILVLVNHLKSKGYGSQASSNARRKLQATRVRAIYEQRRAEGIEHIAIVGDLNDTPGSAPLAPLLTANNSDLRDIFTHPAFNNGGRKGTWDDCTASQKLDYLLLSPALFALVTAGGVERRGIWGGVNGTLFPHYAEITNPDEAASDHAAVWADLNL